MMTKPKYRDILEKGTPADFRWHSLENEKIATALGKAKYARWLKKAAKRIFVGAGIVIGVTDAVARAGEVGVPRAVAENLPLLGDIITAYDISDEFFKGIAEKATKAQQNADEALAEGRRMLVRKLTVGIFNKIAGGIRVQNPSKMDTEEITSAVTDFSGHAEILYRQLEDGVITAEDFAKRMKELEDALRRNLEKAANPEESYIPPEEPPIPNGPTIWQ